LRFFLAGPSLIVSATFAGHVWTDPGQAGNG
jgi:hypothetical protein